LTLDIDADTTLLVTGNAMLNQDVRTSSGPTFDGGITVGNDITSDTDNTDSLGTTLVRWANTFSDLFTGMKLIFDGATSENEIQITDNVADGLSITEGTNDLIVIDTTNTTESITINPETNINANTTIDGDLTVTGTATLNTVEISIDSLSAPENGTFNVQTWQTADGSAQDRISVETSGEVMVTSVTDSTNKDSGSLVLQGGAGIEKNLNVGGNLDITLNATIDGTANITGSTTITGLTTTQSGITTGGNIVSDTDSTDSLGSDSIRFANTYSDNIVGNTIDLDGATGVNILSITDNVADGLSITDGTSDVIVIDTTTGSEVVNITPDTNISGNLDLGGDIDFTAENHLIGASIGANDLTLGGATTDVIIPGSLYVQGTTTSIESTTLDVETKQITVNNGGLTSTSTGSGVIIDGDTTTGHLRASDTDTANLELKAPTGNELTLDVDADSTLTVTGNATLNQNVSTATSPTFTGLDTTEGNITNVGNIALDSLSADESTINVNLGAAAGNDLIVGTDKLIVEGDTGNVGIGNTTPSYPLDITGDIGFTGTLQSGTVPVAQVSGLETIATSGSYNDLYDKPAANDLTQTEVDNLRAAKLDDGTTPWDNANNITSGTLNVDNGGTGQASFVDGELLIGNSTGNTLAKATLTGTTNELDVTNGNGSITLSLPNSVHIGTSGKVGRDADNLIDFATDNSIVFRTNSVDNRLVVDGSGNIGIGTIAPDGELHVFKTLITNPEGGSCILGTSVSNPDSDECSCTAGYNYSDANTNDIYDVEECNKDTNGLVVKNGNLGVGTTTPEESLHVEGNTKVNGNLEITTGKLKAIGGFVIEKRTNEPSTPEDGQMWLRTDI